MKLATLFLIVLGHTFDAFGVYALSTALKGLQSLLVGMKQLWYDAQLFGMRMVCGFSAFTSEPEGRMITAYLIMIGLGIYGLTWLESYRCKQPSGKRPAPSVRILRTKLPAFRDYYHRSFFQRFQKIGFKTLLHPPPKAVVEHKIWCETWKIWKPGWRIKSYFPMSTGYYRYSKEPPWPEAVSFDDPIPPKPLTPEHFKRVRNAAVHGLDAPNKQHTTRSDLEPDPDPGPRKATEFVNMGTVRGRKRAKRLKRKRKRKAMNPCIGKSNNCEYNNVDFIMGNPTGLNSVADILNLSGGKTKRQTDDQFDIIWDTGATKTLTFEKTDFVGDITWFETPKAATGVAGGLRLLGEGMVRWEIQLNDGASYAIEVMAYYCPQSSRRLLSPQQLIQHLKATNKLHLAKIELTEFGLEFRRGRHQFTVLYDSKNNLPISYARQPDQIQCTVSEMSLTEMNACLTAQANQNLSRAQKELLRHHYRCGHLGMQRIQAVLRTGNTAPSKSYKALYMAAGKCPIPKCAACEFAKAKRKPLPGQRIKADDPETTGNVKKGKLLPGQCVAVDHFICSQKGRLFTSAGKTDPSKMYSGGCIFTDMATGYIHIEHVLGTTANETLQAKVRFEEHMREVGVIVQEYRFDNGSAFTSAEFIRELVKQRQVHTYAGVGAHSQNGVAERAILTVVSMARTMMIHSAIHWPAMTDSCLWPMAVSHAAYIHNRFPMRENNLSPYELLTQAPWERRKLQNLHVWGAPVYVLDPKIQNGKTLPRWKPRSRRGMYMGNSPRHASTVPLILNLATHRITAQYHCVFDDWFATVDSDPDEIPDFASDHWVHLFENARFQYIFDDDNIPDLHPDYDDGTRRLQPQAVLQRGEQRNLAIQPNEVDDQRKQQPVIAAQPPLLEPEPSDLPMEPTETTQELPSDEPEVPQVKQEVPDDDPEEDVEPEIIDLTDDTVTTPQLEQPERNDPVTRPPTPRRSNRTTAGKRQTLRYHEEYHLSETGHWKRPCSDHYSLLATTLDPTPLELEFVVSAYAASVSDPDTLSYDEAMRCSDADEFKESARKELESLDKHGTWKIVNKSEAKDKILPGTWIFRRKRHTGTGEIKKYKGRYAARGDLQQGKFDTFAPVVQWSTLRTMLAIALRYKYKTRCIDFSSAFVQADLDKPVWVHFPRGYYPEIFGTDNKDKCLELKKSLYGLSVAPKLWYEHLRTKLLARNFRPSEYDPCLYYRNETAIAIWVDDVVMIGKDTRELDKIIDELRQEFTITDEGTLSQYLGINIGRKVDKDGEHFELTQPELTQKIIKAVGLTGCKSNSTPATQVFGALKDQPKHNEPWDYASVCGMLMYLSNNSRPDIAFAVHQCARFTHDARQGHSTGVKQIVRYLAGTKDKGLIMRTTNKAEVECYVDADFAGGFQKDGDVQDPSTARSRTGFVIFVLGVPVVFVSRLQNEVALSTMESEYVSLSTAARDVLALRNLLKEMGSRLKVVPDFKITAKSTIFEDNEGALTLANAPRLTPRSKHYATKYHFFRDHCKPKGCLHIAPIDTKEQIADILTKPLAKCDFERIREKLSGW